MCANSSKWDDCHIIFLMFPHRQLGYLTLTTFYKCSSRGKSFRWPYTSITPVRIHWVFVHLCFHLSEQSQEIFLLCMGETSAVMEHCCPALPSKKGSSFSGQRGAGTSQASLQPPSPAGAVASWFIHSNESTRPTSAPPTQRSCRAAEVFSTGSQRRVHKCPVLAKKANILACIWAQITAKKGDSSPAFPMRYVSAQSSIAQQPCGSWGGNNKCSDQTAQVATRSSQEALSKENKSD